MQENKQCTCKMFKEYGYCDETHPPTSQWHDSKHVKTLSEVTTSQKTEEEILKGSPAYNKLHYWLRTTYGKATKCEMSGCNRKSKNYGWALIHPHKYEYNRENYWQLCKSCHSKYDLTEEGRQKLILSGSKSYPKRTKNLKLALTGKKRTPEVTKKIGDALRGKPNFSAMKAIYQFTKEGKFIRKHDSLIEAATSVKRTVQAMIYSITNNGLCGGYKWQYELID
jgi:hypothetical protein